MSQQQVQAMSLCTTMELVLMKPNRKTLEFDDFVVTIIVEPKGPPKPHNENVRYEHWNEELKDLFDKYDK
ncbi:hypothetical protein ACVOMS_05630 [Bradyrhizobium guangxiense]